MAIRLPSEIVVERFLPTLRVMLARDLAARGLTQEAIAERLGVTQAAVSTYVSGDATADERLREEPRMQETVERIAEGFATDAIDEYEALAEVLGLVREFEDRGPICELHEEAMPALRGLGCDLCVRGLDAEVAAERDVLSSVREAARLLSTTPGMAEYVPKVGTNVGMALPDPASETDVAAIPGRIYALRGRVEVPSHPEFGASRHVATTVLAANAVDPAVRAAVNVATRDDLIERAREGGIDPLEFDAGYEDRGEHLREAFRERGGVPRVVYHRGAFGIEPVTYVLGETAVGAAEYLVELVRDG